MIQRKLLLIVIATIVFTMHGWAQSGNIRGSVTDTNNVPLPGATVVIQGTANGTQTDFDGNFTLNASVGDVLEVSYIGFKSVTLSLTSLSQSLKIKLQEETSMLDEVVVTALGITRAEKKIGYATQQINTDIVENVSVPNVGSLFTGQVAGLSVNNPTGLFQSPTFNLRGKTPLIVVDNIPIDTDLYDISPSSIANINVLKGTTASALYGSRGRNGAILITTKSAKEEGLNVEFSQNNMFSAGFTVFPKTQTEYGNGSNGKYEFWDGADGGISDGDMIWGPKFSDNLRVAQWNSPIYDNVTRTTIPWWGDVSGTQYDDKSRYSRVPIPWEYHNNLNDFLEVGYISTTQFAVNSKTEKTIMRFSGEYAYQKDRVPNSSMRRGGLNFKSSTFLADNLKLDAKLSYNNVYSPNYPRHGYGPKNHMYTILIWMGDDVNGKQLREHLYVPGQEGYRQANFNYAWYNNVYFASHELTQLYNQNVVNGQLSLTYDISPNLKIMGRGSMVNNHTFEDRKSPKSYLNYGDPRDGDYKTWNKSRLTVDYDILMSYTNDLTTDFSVSANIGASTFYRKYQEEYNATDGLIVPFVYSLNNTKNNVIAKTYLQEKSTNSVYGMLELDFLNTFYVTLTGRNDWSSTLPVQNRSYFYPSASLSVILSNLVTMPEKIDYMKLFSSWAVVSSDLDPYQISPYYNTATAFNSNPQLTYPEVIVNPNIKPEKSTSFELGLNTSMAKSRLNLDFTYYRILDENQIIDLPISETTAFTKRKVNGNEYTTNGFEVVLSGTPIKNTDFQWKSMLNWSTQVKKITKIYNDNTSYGNLRLNDRADSYYATVWQKSADGRLILNSNGLPIRDAYRALLGHLNPDWTFGLQNNFTYKNWTLGIAIDGVWGGLINSITTEKMWWGGKHPNSTEYRDAEYAAGVPVYVPNGVQVVSGELRRDVNGNVLSDTREYQENSKAVSWQTWSQNYPYRAKVLYSENKKFANVFERTFIKLRSVALKYDLTHLMNSKTFKHFDVTLTGYNLAILKKAELIDPDFGNDDNLQDPSSRYIGFGINAKF